MSGLAKHIQDTNGLGCLTETLASSQTPFWTSRGVLTAEFSSLLSQLLQVVVRAAQSANNPNDLATLVIELSRDPDEANDFGIHGRDKIVIGERLLERLNRSITAYTAYLVYNYRFQTAPAIGPQLKYYELLEPAAFADQAVQMYASAYLPRAATEDGFVRSDFENLMTTLAASLYPDPSESAEGAPLPFSLPKPPADIRVFHSHNFHEEDEIRAYVGSEGRHRKFLHARLLCGVLTFAIAHEVAHVQLGHVEQQAHSPAASRRDEFLADELGYGILERIAGYDIGVLPVLFSFIQTMDNVSEDASHPLSAARLRALYDLRLEKDGSPTARGEVAAALSLLASNLAPIQYHMAWPNGNTEDLTITCSYYQDPNFVLHIHLYLQRKSLLETHDGADETSAILDAPAIRVLMTITSGDDSDNEVCRAVSVCHREMANCGLSYGVQAGDHIARRDLEIRIPPDYWLATPSIRIRIDSVGVTDDPNKTGCSFEVDRAPRSNAFELTTIDSGNLLVAARWYSDDGDADRALTLYEHLLSRSPSKLGYADFIALCNIYAGKERFPDLERVARGRVAESDIRPGFHYFLGIARLNLGDASEALEHAFQEMFGMGEHGAFNKQAGALFADILKQPHGNWIDHLRGYYGWTMAIDGLPWWLRWMALRYHLAAYQEIRQAEEALSAPYICVRQVRYETELAICEITKKSLERAKSGFESIIAQQPSFVPAYIQLARIASLGGNSAESRQWWQKAKEIVPSHNFVLDFRKTIIPRGPVRSTRATGPVRRWLRQRLLAGKRFDLSQ